MTTTARDAARLPDDIRREIERGAAGGRMTPWLLTSLALLATLVGARRLAGGHVGTADLVAAIVIAGGPLFAGWKNRQRAQYLATLTTPEEFLDYYRAQKQEEARDAQRLLWLLVLPLVLFVLPIALMLHRLGQLPLDARLWTALAAMAVVIVVLVAWLVRRIRKARRLLTTLNSPST